MNLRHLDAVQSLEWLWRATHQMRVALALILCLIGTPALAQAVQQSGAVTPFHAPVWTQNGVQGDAGTPAAPATGALGLFNGPTCPFGISSQTAPGVNTLPAGQFTICQTATGTTLNVNGVNGQPTPSFSVNIGGVNYPFPGPGTGNVVGPATSAVDNTACFNNTSGTLLKVCTQVQGLNITRAQIPSIVIGTNQTIQVNGYRTANDLGAGAIYTSVGATSAGWGAIQDGGGTWFNLVPGGSSNPGLFGAYGDNGTHKLSSSDIPANAWWRPAPPGETWSTVTTWDTLATQQAIYFAFATTSTPSTIKWNSLQSPTAFSLNQVLRIPGPTSGAAESYGINQTLLDVGAFETINFDSAGVCWIWQGATNASMFQNNSLSYATVSNPCMNDPEQHPYGTAAPMWNLDWDGVYGGLKTQQITVIGGTFSVSTNGRGVAIAKAGGAAQGSTVNFINSEFVGFASDYCVYVGGDNAIAIQLFGGDMQGCNHYGIENVSGTVYVYGTTFENGATYTGDIPVTSQITTDGADVTVLSGIGESELNNIKNSRSESLKLVVCATGAQCTAEGDMQATGGGNQQPWVTGYAYAEGSIICGTLVACTSAPGGHVFAVADDGGNGDCVLSGCSTDVWVPVSGLSGTTLTTLTDSTAAYTAHQWAGGSYVLLLRYFNGNTVSEPISDNTATTITVSTPFTGLAAQYLAEYHVAGVSGASEPTWAGATPSGVYPFNLGSGYGLSITAGSNLLTIPAITGTGVNGATVTPAVGMYVLVPNADTVGQNRTVSGEPEVVRPAALVAEITSWNSGTRVATLSRNAKLTVTQGPGYWGSVLTDGVLSELDLSFCEMAGVVAADSQAVDGLLCNSPNQRNYSTSRADYNLGANTAAVGATIRRLSFLRMIILARPWSIRRATSQVLLLWRPPSTRPMWSR